MGLGQTLLEREQFFSYNHDPFACVYSEIDSVDLSRFEYLNLRP